MATKATAASAGTSTTVTRWQFPIHLEEGQHAVPQVPWDKRIKKGDFVSFISPDGVPRVLFEGTNPFSKDPGFIIADSGAHEVVSELTKDDPGQAYCWIKLKGTDKYVGYGTKSSKDRSGYVVPPKGGGGG